MWRLGVPKKYVMNIPISGFLAAITIKVLGRFVPEAYAFGVGVFVLGITLYPLDRAFALRGENFGSFEYSSAAL
jgi:hypothetical protein